MYAVPEMMSAAASDLAGVGSALHEAHAAAAAPTVGLIPAAADEVSAAAAKLFSGHAAAFQSLGQQAAAFHNQFTQMLKAGVHVYSATEAASTSLLTTLQGEIASLIRQLPIGIQNFLSTLTLDISGFAVVALIIGYFAFAWLFTAILSLFGL